MKDKILNESHGLLHFCTLVDIPKNLMKNADFSRTLQNIASDPKLSVRSSCVNFVFENGLLTTIVICNCLNLLQAMLKGLGDSNGFDFSVRLILYRWYSPL
jgi:hypothetical protein